MTIMDFSFCGFIREIPNVSRLPNLEKLTLDHCIRLVEVHCSVGLLDKLVVLSLHNCNNLTIFPRSFKLRSLEYLHLGGCSMLKTFPEIEFPMEALEYISLDSTSIEELPSSIGYLIGVKQMLLSYCRKLTNLPNTIHKLQHLKELFLEGCIGIKKLPSSIGYLGRIKTLDLAYSINLMNLPYSIYQLQHLEILNLIKCEQLQEILRLPPNVVQVQAGECVSLAIFLEEPRRSQLLKTWDSTKPVGVRTASSALRLSSLGNNVVTKSDFLIERDCPRNLKVLDLTHSAIVSLHTWLNRFVRLEELYLSHCKKLEEIPKLPPNIKVVFADGCTSLERFQYNNINDLPMLEWIDFSDCHRLPENMRDDLQIRLMSEVHIYIHIYTYY